MNIKVGDKVKVISGREKGKDGVVSKVLTKASSVIVEGLNKKKRSRKLDGNNKDNFVFLERSMHISNVKLVSSGAKKTKKKVVVSK